MEYLEVNEGNESGIKGGIAPTPHTPLERRCIPKDERRKTIQVGIKRRAEPSKELEV
jgi:hypothetical protein